MIQNESLEVWAKGREFPFLSDNQKQSHFEVLRKGCHAAANDQREWAFEALYRLLWDFSPEQRAEAIALLAKALSDPNQKCAERGIKGLQFAIEFMGPKEAEMVVQSLYCVTKAHSETMQVIAIELAYSLYTLFAGDLAMTLRCVQILLHLETINPQWVARTVPSVDRIHSLAGSLSIGIQLKTVGLIRNGYSTLRQMDQFDTNSISKIHIAPEYENDLKGIETLEYIVAVCYLDEQKPLLENASLRQSKKHNPDFGQFATSHPIRRNAVFYKTGRLAGVEGNIVLVQGIRVLDMTPVLDLRLPNIHDTNGLNLCSST